jgi:hypothetical protein
MTINFTTENIVIIVFPKGSGGEFLLNALSLSDNAVLQNATLARLQLDNNLSSKEKFNILIDELSISCDGDLLTTHKISMLNSKKLFGIDGYRYFLDFNNIESYMNSIIQLLSNSSFKFFLSTNSQIYLDIFLSKWRNAKIVKLENNNNFLEWRYNRKIDRYDFIQVEWDKIKGEQWPTIAPKNLSDFQLLSYAIQNELIINFTTFFKNFLIYNKEYSADAVINMLNNHKCIDIDKIIFDIELERHRFEHIFDWRCITSPDTSLLWDSTWFFSENNTVKNLNNLCDQLGLIKPNDLLIRKYYQSWIKEIKNY